MGCWVTLGYLPSSLLSLNSQKPFQTAQMWTKDTQTNTSDLIAYIFSTSGVKTQTSIETQLIFEKLFQCDGASFHSPRSWRLWSGNLVMLLSVTQSWVNQKLILFNWKNCININKNIIPIGLTFMAWGSSTLLSEVEHSLSSDTWIVPMESLWASVFRQVWYPSTGTQ